MPDDSLKEMWISIGGLLIIILVAMLLQWRYRRKTGNSLLRDALLRCDVRKPFRRLRESRARKQRIKRERDADFIAKRQREIADENRRQNRLRREIAPLEKEVAQFAESIGLTARQTRLTQSMLRTEDLERDLEVALRRQKKRARNQSAAAAAASLAITIDGETDEPEYCSHVLMDGKTDGPHTEDLDPREVVNRAGSTAVARRTNNGSERRAGALRGSPQALSS